MTNGDPSRANTRRIDIKRTLSDNHEAVICIRLRTHRYSKRRGKNARAQEGGGGGRRLLSCPVEIMTNGGKFTSLLLYRTCAPVARLLKRFTVGILRFIIGHIRGDARATSLTQKLKVTVERAGLSRDSLEKSRRADRERRRAVNRETRLSRCYLSLCVLALRDPARLISTNERAIWNVDASTYRVPRRARASASALPVS